VEEGKEQTLEARKVFQANEKQFVDKSLKNLKKRGKLWNSSLG